VAAQHRIWWVTCTALATPVVYSKLIVSEDACQPLEEI
jgi:hypothetical protein